MRTKSMVNIKQLRISEKNNTHSRLRELKSFLRNKTKSIQIFRKDDGNGNIGTITKLEEKVCELKLEIKNLEEKIELINKGGMDEILLKECEENQQKIKERALQKKIKKKIIEKDKNEKRERSTAFYKQTYSAKREQRYENKNLDYYNRYFNKVVSSIPEYLTKKLDKMPNNKGYIFRGVFLYGKLSCENQNKTTMFETKNKVQYIHEWDKETNLYSLYKKHNRGRPVLIKQQPRSLLKQTSLNFEIKER